MLITRQSSENKRPPISQSKSHLFDDNSHTSTLPSPQSLQHPKMYKAIVTVGVALLGLTSALPPHEVDRTPSNSIVDRRTTPCELQVITEHNRCSDDKTIPSETCQRILEMNLPACSTSIFTPDPAFNNDTINDRPMTPCETQVAIEFSRCSDDETISMEECQHIAMVNMPACTDDAVATSHLERRSIESEQLSCKRKAFDMLNLCLDNGVDSEVCKIMSHIDMDQCEFAKTGKSLEKPQTNTTADAHCEHKADKKRGQCLARHARTPMLRKVRMCTKVYEHAKHKCHRHRHHPKPLPVDPALKACRKQAIAELDDCKTNHTVTPPSLRTCGKKYRHAMRKCHHHERKPHTSQVLNSTSVAT